DLRRRRVQDSGRRCREAESKGSAARGFVRLSRHSPHTTPRAGSAFPRLHVQTGARPMQIERRFTTAGKSPYEKVPFRRATSEIKNPDGSIVFRLENFAVPEHWSAVAADILAQKYFRKAGVPARLKRIEETQVPSWLWRSTADERALA